jgi:hypothetical protein
MYKTDLLDVSSNCFDNKEVIQVLKWQMIKYTANSLRAARCNMQRLEWLLKRMSSRANCAEGKLVNRREGMHRLMGGQSNHICRVNQGTAILDTEEGFR